MPPHVLDGTLLILLATILVTFQRIGLAMVVGGIGVWLVARFM